MLSSVDGVSGGLALATPAAAKGDHLRQRGTGTADSTWAAKLREKKDAIRGDFWVKTQQTGQAWSFTRAQDAATFPPSTLDTRAHDEHGQDDSGHAAEAKWRTVAPQADGTDVFVMTAARTGETCAVTLTF